MGRLVTRLVLVGLFAAVMAVGLAYVRPQGEGTDLEGGATAASRPPGPAPGEPAPLPALPGGTAGAANRATSQSERVPPGTEGPGGPTPTGDSASSPVRLAGVVRDTEGRPAEGAVVSVAHTWTLHPPQSGDNEVYEQSQDDGVELTADAQGCWSIGPLHAKEAGEGRAENSLRIEVRGGGYALGGGPMDLPFVTNTAVVIEVRRLPALRVQVLDADTRAAMTGVQWAGCQSRADGDWWVLWSVAGAREVSVTAPGCVTARPTLQFPDTGTVTRGDPILLERGFRVHGTVRASGSAALAGAFVLAERVGGPPSSVSGFVHAPNNTSEGRFELVVPPGAYRLLAFAKGHAPAVVDVAVQDGDQQVDPELRRFGTEGPPPGLPFRWADRRDVAIPIETAELPGAELVAWIEAIVGAPVAIEPDARAMLAQAEMNASFIGIPAGAALNLVAQLAALAFDPEAGAIRVPR